MKCWRSCACSVLHGPAELDADDKQQLSTAKELHHLLAFASAVGSTEMLLTVACSQLEDLRSVVTVQDKQAELFMREWPHDTAEADVCFYDAGNSSAIRWESVQQEREAKQQVAAQTCALLHMAHTLRLQPLLDTLHSFLFAAGSSWGGLLYGMLDLVFTEAVLDAALGSGTISKEIYIHSVLTRPCAIHFRENSKPLHLSGLLEPTGGYTCDLESGRLGFEARLLQDFAGGKAGDGVRVTLALFGSNPHLNLLWDTDEETLLWLESFGGAPHSADLPVQLLLGTSITSAADLRAVTRSKLPF